ncbi:hypothetical protein AgCh_017844 [Apium graveolens]
MLFFVFDSKVCRVCGNLCVKNATLIHLHDKKVVELESGCGLVRGIAALLREHVLLTDFPDRLKLLKKNVQKNLYANVQVSATVIELTCGDHPHPKLMNPSPDYDLEHLLDLEEAGAKDAILENEQTSLQLGSKLLKGPDVNSDDISYLSQLVRDSMEQQAQSSDRTASKETEAMKSM